jgi:hypothetical protein
MLRRKSTWVFTLIFAMALTGAQPGTAGAESTPTKNRPPNTPTDLATEYPQPEPVLHGTFSDPDGGTGQVLFTIYDLGGSMVVQDAPGQTVASGSDSSYTIPSGTLADGVRYRWTARSFDGITYSSPTTEPDFVATSVGTLATTAVNPWGCVVKALNPHSSSPYIKAEGQTNCTTVPSGVTIEHQQNLYRSSWSGWRFVGYNDSWCDSGSHSSGQPTPQCHPLWTAPRMQAYVWWNCVAAGFQGGWYNYLMTDDSSIRKSGTTYSASDQKQTGNWNDPGKVQCQ